MPILLNCQLFLLTIIITDFADDSQKGYKRLLQYLSDEGYHSPNVSSKTISTLDRNGGTSTASFPMNNPL